MNGFETTEARAFDPLKLVGSAGFEPAIFSALDSQREFPRLKA